MSTPVVAPEKFTSLDLSRQVPSGTQCPACRHEVDDHDSVSLRYCRATAAGRLSRGCICPLA